MTIKQCLDKMSIDQMQNITTDNAQCTVEPKLNNLDKPGDHILNCRTPPSPISSINNVTIESLSDDDSSVVDSDSDIEDIPKSPSDFLRNRIMCTSNEQNQGVIVINETISSDNNNVAKQPQIGSIAVQNSSDITFGNKTFYQGPVTIKQFLLEKNQWRPADLGAENKAFDGSNVNISVSDGKFNYNERNRHFMRR